LISNNPLNLPQGIHLNGATQILEVTDYCGNFVYTKKGDDAQKLDYILTGEGRITMKSGQSKTNSTKYEFEYFINDHLGNTRVVQTAGGEITQRADYYPFGMMHQPNQTLATSTNKILFQGQELQLDYNLNWYHYRFRMHDPAIARFMCVDPLAEKYAYNSVYAFSENRVVDGVELEGAEFHAFVQPALDLYNNTLGMFYNGMKTVIGNQYNYMNDNSPVPAQTKQMNYTLAQTAAWTQTISGLNNYYYTLYSSIQYAVLLEMGALASSSKSILGLGFKGVFNTSFRTIAPSFAADVTAQLTYAYSNGGNWKD